MSYQTELSVPSYIVGRVMGRRVRMVNEETQEEEVYRETIHELSQKFEVEIKYDRNTQKFTITGSQESADEVAQKLHIIQKKKVIEKMAEDKIEDEKRQQRQILGYDPYEDKMDDEGFLCIGANTGKVQKKIYEMKKQTKTEEKKKKKESTPKNEIFIDRNNVFGILSIDGDEESERVQVKLNYERHQESIKEQLSKLEKRYAKLGDKLTQAEKNKIYKLTPYDKSDKTQELDLTLQDAVIIKFRKELIRIEHQFESLEKQELISFEQYETDPECFTLNMINEKELDEIVDAEVDYPPESETDKEVQENKEQRRNRKGELSDLPDEVIEKEIGQFMESNFPRNREYYKRRQYRDKNTNSTKSETWTYAKENHKRDNRKHAHTKTRHHSRGHEHFNSQDMKDELTNSMTMPTDHIKDKLDELIGSEQDEISVFPPLVLNGQ